MSKNSMKCCEIAIAYVKNEIDCIIWGGKGYFKDEIGRSKILKK
jgi:hypothetical protein